MIPKPLPGIDASANGSVNELRITGLVGWMIDGARSSTTADAFVDDFCRCLLTGGIPLNRFGLFVNTLHPNVASRRLLWTALRACRCAKAP